MIGFKQEPRSEERWDKAEILDQKLGYTSNP